MTLHSKPIAHMAAEYARAWSSGSPEAVANHYSENGQIEINGGEPHVGRAAIAEMAAGFFKDFPGMIVKCDNARSSDRNAVFVWTLEGEHAETKHSVSISGWEEWLLDDNMQVVSSRGWFDAADFQDQIEGKS